MASTVIVTNIPVPNSNSLIHNTVNAKKRSCAAEGGRNFLYIHASKQTISLKILFSKGNKASLSL